MTAQAVKDIGAGAAVDAAPASAPEGLYEKLALITSEAQVKATGKNEQGGLALSIADVERVIGELCGKHGVVTRWSLVSLDSYDQPLPSREVNGHMVERSMRMWLSHLRVKVINASLPDESFEDEWTDIGTNPMAASSFVRKGYYRSLFHLADEADEAKGVTLAEGGTGAAALPPARSTGTGPRPLGPCPECAEEGITAASGKPAAYWPPRHAGKPPQCNGYRDGVYMNHQMRALSWVGAAVSAAADAAEASPDENGKLPWE